VGHFLSGDPGHFCTGAYIVDSASFGAGPRMHVGAANAYRDTFKAVLTGPNADGSAGFQLTMASGTFIAGPYAGQRFTISNFELKGWSGSNGCQNLRKQRVAHNPDGVAC